MDCVSRVGATPRLLNEELPPDDVIFGNSSAGEAVRLSVEMAATANVPVLLQGQSGTGKEILARYIHRRSVWGSGGFVKVNCPAIPGTLLESELFGYQKGAFTGAYTSKLGRVDFAHRGTLFLDEIAELDPGLQAKLLQLLQDGHFCRIGSQEESKVDVRFVCATNRQLDKEIKTGTFRQDLFYRINVLTIELPSLQQRIGDLPILVDYLLQKYSKNFNRPVRPLSSGSLESLQEYNWPGNIRELENVVKRYVIVGKEEAITKSVQRADPEDLIGAIPTDGVTDLKSFTKRAVKQLEQQIILKTLETHRWNRRTTAHVLGLSYAALLYKMRDAGVPPRGPGRRSKKGAPPIPAPALTADGQLTRGHQHQTEREHLSKARIA